MNYYLDRKRTYIMFIPSSIAGNNVSHLQSYLDDQNFSVIVIGLDGLKSVALVEIL